MAIRFPNRSETRYRFPARSLLSASLGSDDTKIIGILKDISRAGFRLIARETPPKDWGEGTAVRGEFRIGAKIFTGMGTVRHIKQVKVGQCFIGFKFNNNAITDLEWCNALEVILHEKNAGGIQPAGPKNDFSVIKVVGTLSMSLMEELLMAIESGNTRAIDMSQCIRIDEVEVDLLRAINAKKISFINSVGAVREMLISAKLAS